MPLPSPALPKASILIVGAGPAGLAAAIEFRRLGHAVRIIDQLPEGAKKSRAVVVNTKSLKLLEASGATARLLAAGVRVKAMRLMVDGVLRARIETGLLPKPYDFMLCLPQNVTEAILTATLADYGIAPERGVAFIALAQHADGVTATLQHAADSRREEVTADWLVAADGAHSAVRHALGLDFAGGAYPFQWSLADVDLAGDVAPDEGEARISPGKPFIFRVPIAPGRHRIIANAPGVLSLVPQSWGVGAVHWTSDFTVSHRMVDTRLVGRIALIGDASHIHSPAGGRGMNLGIEDAASLADAVNNGLMVAWAEQRVARARSVLKGSDAMQSLVTIQDGWSQRLMLRVATGLASIRFIQRKILRQIAAVEA